MVARVRAGGERAWGGLPDVVAAAPGRVNLIGEHTDYNQGLCLPLALPHATYAAATARQDGRVRIASAQGAEPWHGTLEQCGPGSVTGWPAYLAGVLWGLTQEGWQVPGLDLYIDSTVPLGAGLSSSASVECATGAAVAGLLGLSPRDPEVAATLVAAGMRAESEVAGAPTGGMDQSIAVYGAADTALLLDFENSTRRAIPLDLGAEGLALLVVDTRVSHALTDGGYATRRAECEEVAGLLGVASLRAADQSVVDSVADERLRRRARHVVTEIQRVRSVVGLLTSGSVASIGPILVASHASLRDDFEVSCPELDLVVTQALAAGALGARMTGGGFGGSAVALVPESAVAGVCAQITAAAARASFPEPRFLRAVPSVGARLFG